MLCHPSLFIAEEKISNGDCNNNWILTLPLRTLLDPFNDQFSLTDAFKLYYLPDATFLSQLEWKDTSLNLWPLGFHLMQTFATWPHLLNILFKAWNTICNILVSPLNIYRVLSILHIWLLAPGSWEWQWTHPTCLLRWSDTGWCNDTAHVMTMSPVLSSDRSWPWCPPVTVSTPGPHQCHSRALHDMSRHHAV